MGRSLKEYREALIACDGVQVRVAAMLGVSRAAVSQRLRANPKLKALELELLESVSDLAEGAVRMEVKAEFAAAAAAAKAAEESGAPPATIDPKTSKWWLEKKGKDRGFGPTVGVRLDDDAIADLIRQVGEQGGVDAVRKLAEGR